MDLAVIPYNYAVRENIGKSAKLLSVGKHHILCAHAHTHNYVTAHYTDKVVIVTLLP